MKKLLALFKRKTLPVAAWHPQPNHPGWWVIWVPSHGLDVMFFPGDDDPAFEICKRGDSQYFGPFRLPLK
jgi:hypothetical protein